MKIITAIPLQHLFKRSPFALFVLCLSVSLPAQDNLYQPVFSAFEGVVYKIPIKRLKNGYGPDILQLPVVDTIRWETIHFPDSDVEETPFPNVPLKQGFGIIFTATVQIPRSGWYQFSTNSDDGTILWINRERIVNNDKDHRMRLRSDTVALQAGAYPVRFWYYQAYPTRYGVQLEGRYYRDFWPDEQHTEVILLTEEQLQFAHNSSELSEVAREVIDQLGKRLQAADVRSINITGHTDNVGTSAYNRQLSLARAEAVKNRLVAYLKREVPFAVQAKGETEPIASNETDEGRAKNRRVEIEIVY